MSRLTSKCQTTIPKMVREALAIKPGDVIVYERDGAAVRLSKAKPADLVHLSALAGTLGEWTSSEDAAAYDDL